MLENRKLAMAVDGTYALAWTHKINADLGVACLPKMKQTGTVVVADVRAAMNSTKHPDEAYKWVRMTANPVYQSTFLKIGLVVAEPNCIDDAQRAGELDRRAHEPDGGRPSRPATTTWLTNMCGTTP